jgi:hypothetical protein
LEESDNDKGSSIYSDVTHLSEEDEDPLESGLLLSLPLCSVRDVPFVGPVDRRGMVYCGSSDRTKRRRKFEFRAASVNTRRITDYFEVVKDTPKLDEGIVRTRTRYDYEKLQERHRKLSEICKGFKNKAKMRNQKIDKELGNTYLMHVSVLHYYDKILGGMGQVEAAVCAAQIVNLVYKGKGTSYLGRKIRLLGHHYYDFEWFPDPEQGKHRNITSLIEDEDVQADCRQWVRS